MAWSDISKINLDITLSEASVGSATAFREAINANDNTLKSTLITSGASLTSESTQQGLVGAINSVNETLEEDIKALPQVFIGTSPNPIGRAVQVGDIWLEVTG